MSPPWLGQPLRNICVSNGHGYVPFVVITINVMSSFMVYHMICKKSNTTWSRNCLPFVTTWPHHDILRILCFLSFSILSFWLPLWYFQYFFNTFWNILRKKYRCSKTIGKTPKDIRKLVYQDYKNCIHVFPSVCAWSIWKSPNQNLIAETS